MTLRDRWRGECSYYLRYNRLPPTRKLVREARWYAARSLVYGTLVSWFERGVGWIDPGTPYHHHEQYAHRHAPHALDRSECYVSGE